MSRVSVVIIGRNEGERLRHALESTRANSPSQTVIVYVDSSSTDGSVALAGSLGAHVVELDVTIPFTAGRARNEGAALARNIAPESDLIFFMDGDCRLVPLFLEQAIEFLDAHPAAAVVCGQRREIRPDRNVYHRLAELEWNTPVGLTLACGGDALFRRDAFDRVGGFDPTVVAGEEPELCVRIRAAGGEIHRLPLDMTLHDVDMSRLGQWWKRSVRAGFAFATGTWMHGKGPQRHWLRPTLRVWFWAVLLPALALIPAYWTHCFSLLLLLAYVKPWYGAYTDRRARGDGPSDAALYAWFCILAKFAELQGQLRFLTLRLTRRTARIIEYKSAPPSSPVHSNP